MDYLNWELTVLAKAVGHQNLSTAASHIGVSQPQLSRIVRKLEDDLGVTLLDRGSRRKSRWSPAAYRVADIYTRALQGFRGEIRALGASMTLSEIRVCTLEGLADQAVLLGHGLMAKGGVEVLHLDVEDLSELEEYFLKGAYDLALTIREPGKRKLEYVRRLGVQRLESSGSGTRILSSFEFGSASWRGVDPRSSARKRPDGSIVVSNSLEVRRKWQKTYGGCGSFPSELRPGKGALKESEIPVLLLGSPTLPKEIWAAIETDRS